MQQGTDALFVGQSRFNRRLPRWGDPQPAGPVLPPAQKARDAVKKQKGAADIDMLRDALATLPPSQRQAIKLLNYMRFSPKEASAATGMSISALKVATRRARACVASPAQEWTPSAQSFLDTALIPVREKLRYDEAHSAGDLSSGTVAKTQSGQERLKRNPEEFLDNARRWFPLHRRSGHINGDNSY